MGPELKANASKRFVTPQHWNTDFVNKPYFTHLEALFSLSEYKGYPGIGDLNNQAERFGLEEYRFVADSHSQEHNPGALYYEQFIFEKQRIPTRQCNWHDLFNAIIWCLFPNTKRYLNQIHIGEINDHGLHPRSPVRNRVTHFDECGGILVYQEESHLEALQNHHWQEAFCQKRSLWEHSTRLYIFGHANYEMLLAPYIGLTAKYLPVKVQESFWELSLDEQYTSLDKTLLLKIQQELVFQQKGQLKPIPLLGIPGWWQQQTPEFYGNTDYFRPLRR